MPAALGPTVLMSTLSWPSQRAPSFGEDLVDAGGVADVRDHADGVGTADSAQFLGGFVEPRCRPSDDRDAGAVLGQAAGGREPHATAAADDDGGGVREAEIHDAA